MDWLWDNFHLVSPKAPLEFQQLVVSKLLYKDLKNLSIPALAVLELYNRDRQPDDELWNCRTFDQETWQNLAIQTVLQEIFRKNFLQNRNLKPTSRRYRSAAQSFLSELKGVYPGIPNIENSDQDIFAQFDFRVDYHVTWESLSIIFPEWDWSRYDLELLFHIIVTEMSMTDQGWSAPDDPLRRRYNLLQGFFLDRNWRYLSDADLKKFAYGWSLEYLLDQHLHRVSQAIIILQNNLIQEISISQVYHAAEQNEFLGKIISNPFQQDL